MSVKTILVAHRSLAVRDRFAAALADAQQDYLLAGAEPALRAALSNDRVPVSLALLDLGLAGDRDAARFISEIRASAPRPFPVVVFAGSVTAADQIATLGNAGVAGYVNEYADAPQILPSLAPHLFPDRVKLLFGENDPCMGFALRKKLRMQAAVISGIETI